MFLSFSVIDVLVWACILNKLVVKLHVNCFMKSLVCAFDLGSNKKDSDLVLVFFHAYAYLWNNLIFIANFMRANCFVIFLVHALAKLQIRL